MNTEREVAVTLSARLYKKLAAEAEATGLPLQWLVAALVVEAFDGSVPALSAA
jgi:hypothetical protein